MNIFNILSLLRAKLKMIGPFCYRQLQVVELACRLEDRIPVRPVISGRCCMSIRLPSFSRPSWSPLLKIAWISTDWHVPNGTDCSRLLGVVWIHQLDYTMHIFHQCRLPALIRLRLNIYLSPENEEEHENVHVMHSCTRRLP
jgi:hypothetical protein